MAREITHIAILATGDEIIDGDIINSNSTYLAAQLKNHHLRPGWQLAVRDDQAAITQAIKLLFDNHDIIVTIGGLGPTSDDKTRFAVAAAFGLELEFNEAAWEHVVNRLKNYGKIPENNRLQALFPQGHQLIINPNGSACACLIAVNNKLLFMLPGPPNEFKYLVDQHVIPELTTQLKPQTVFRKHYLLLNTSEGEIAERLDNLSKGKAYTIGYRVNYPYLEIKIISEDEKILGNACQLIEPILQPNIVSLSNQTASQQLTNVLQNYPGRLIIADEATHGYFAQRLINPLTKHKITYDTHPINTDIKVSLQGLTSYWEGTPDKPVVLDIMIDFRAKQACHHFSFPQRGSGTLLKASEIAAWLVYSALSAQ